MAEEESNIWTAAGDGDLARVTHLVNHGESVNAQDESGYTPLQAAASYSNVEVLRYLLANGADVNLTDNDGDTALHVCEDPECASLLLDAGADLTKVNSEGLVAYQVAYQEFRDELVSFLAGVYTTRGIPVPIAERVEEVDEEGDEEDEGAEESKTE